VTERWTAESLPMAVTSFITEARSGRLATVTARNEPRVMPVCFALLMGPAVRVVSVLDEKPKRVADGALARVRNLERHPAACLLVDHYEEAWQHLAFAQVNGMARVMSPGAGGHQEAIEALRAKYVQYRAMDIASRPVILLEVSTVTTWRGDGGTFGAEG
jgi:PPOX class probable F420-dependent enzyme